MLKDLVKLANDLDAKGLKKEADYLDSVIQKCAQMLSADENSMSIISNIQDAIDAVQSGKSFRFPISKSDEDKINSLTKSSSSAEVALEKRAFLSSDTLKVVAGGLGILGVLISLAMYFGYNIRVRGKRGETEGELVFKAPDEASDKTPELEDSNLLGEDTISLPLDNKAPALIG